MTKYRRIQMLLKEAKYNDILCLDNDITPDKKNILNFISNCFYNDYSIAWGKIKAKSIKGFIPKLIEIDKILSHTYIRPILWRLNIGISLPGQIFMINKRYLENKLFNVDTVYDDLMIGACVRENKFPIFFVKDILGFEKPKKNIKELLKQRIRWAKGLAETIIYNKKNKVLPYILLHGFSFNLLWIPFYILLIILIGINKFLGVAIFLIVAYILTEKNIRSIVWAILYMIIFPYIYIVWGFSLIYYFVKITIFNKRKENSKRWIANLNSYFKKLVNMQKRES